jgi:hypothetical protein
VIGSDVFWGTGSELIKRTLFRFRGYDDLRPGGHSRRHAAINELSGGCWWLPRRNRSAPKRCQPALARPGAISGRGT